MRYRVTSNFHLLAYLLAYLFEASVAVMGFEFRNSN